MRKLSLLIYLILGQAFMAYAQGVSVQGQAIVNTTTSVSGIPGNTVLQAVPNAQITVCSSAGGGIPCSPLVTIYSNVALTVVAANPLTADANGNFSFFVPPNATGYIYSQTGSGITGQLFTISPQTSLFSGTIIGPVTGSPQLTWTPTINGATCTVVGAQAAISSASAAGGGIVDWRACTTISTNITNATGTLAIPSKVTFLSGPAVWGCSISTPHMPCVAVTGSDASLYGTLGNNIQTTATNQTGTIIRAVAGIGTTNDLLAINPSPSGALEGAVVDGITLDEANTSATTGRYCLSLFGVSNSWIRNVWGWNCGVDGLHVESTPFHSYDMTFDNVKIVAVGGVSGYSANGFLWTTGSSITNIVGNGTTATLTCVEACPITGTSITIAQNSQAGFNVTASITNTGTHTATFSNATNATGTGGVFTYLGLTDIDRQTCHNCVYYAYNPGTTTSPLANYGMHFQTDSAATSCSTQNCGSIADTKLDNIFIQGVVSNASNAGVFLERIDTHSFITHFYLQGEVEDSFNSNLATGLKASTPMSNNNLSNIHVYAAGFANYATQHNLSAGGSGTAYDYDIRLSPVAVPEIGSMQFTPQTLTGSTTVNPNCHMALKSNASGTYCWYFAADGTWRYARTDVGPADLVRWDGQNTRTYPVADNSYSWGVPGSFRWASIAAFNGRFAQAISDQGAACTNGELALSAGWQSTGSATITAVTGNGQTCSWTITTGTTTAANPTVTDTLTNALPTATTVCEMNIHGGTHTPAAGEGFTQTTLSATAPVFTFIGTPTAGGTTYFVTRRCGP